MNQLLNLKRINSVRDINAVRSFYDEIESHVKSLDSLCIDPRNYGTLLLSIVMERLPHQVKLLVTRNIKESYMIFI